MWDDFNEAFVHGDHVILGRRLRPFCAYYHSWLKMIKSPLLTGGNITILDLEVATRICSSPYGQAPSCIKPHWTDKFRILYLSLFHRIPDLCDSFAAYIEDYNSPPLRQSNTNTKSSSSSELVPYEIWLTTGLMTLFHMPPRQAWMLPIGEAEWYIAVSDIHREKSCGILPGHDREFIQGLRELKEKESHGKK